MRFSDYCRDIGTCNDPNVESTTVWCMKKCQYTMSINYVVAQKCLSCVNLYYKFDHEFTNYFAKKSVFIHLFQMS